MEREVERKTFTYGIAAILLAVVLTAFCYNFGVQPILHTDFSQLKTFTSYEELQDFLKTGMEDGKGLSDIPMLPTFRGGEEVFSQDAAPAQKPTSGSGAEYSTTNIQVAGVDEADVVKTDGEYLYVVSDSTVYILKAHPPAQSELLSKIELNQTYKAEIYLQREGDRLAVIGNNYSFPTGLKPEVDSREIYSIPYTQQAFVKVYDIQDKHDPLLARTVILNGTLSGSRKIGNFIYAVINQQAVKPDGNQTELEVMLPRISGDYTEVVEPTEIRYVDAPDTSYSFTTVVAVNMVEDEQKPTYESFLAGQTAQMYVSLNNMYLVVPNTYAWILRDNEDSQEETLIYRIKLGNGEISAEAQGEVQGYVLNQFSMDEYQDHFRIATTKWTKEGSKNNLFILNMSLNVVGRLEGLAPGEQIYSARFMGDRCYLVTFRQIDPFYVIDVSQPTQPKVLGYLKIPGFSGYLHPYDSNYIIGVGMEENQAKLSFFDVTDVEHPQEIDKYIVMPGAWSHTPVLNDHKAFLFEKSKNLLALPVSINGIELNDKYRGGFWQGAYVFNLSLERGFVLKGNITHQNSETQLEYHSEVKRIIYIEETIYTISNKKVRMSDLEDLKFQKEVDLIES